MKKPKVLLLTAVLFAALPVYLIVNKYTPKENARDEKSYERGEDEEEGEERESGVEKEMMSWYQSRGYPNPYFMNLKYQRAWEQFKKLKDEAGNPATRIQSAANWSSLGPSANIGGRILTIAINPVKSTSIYIGSASGGIWKSYNGGTNWQPVTTDFPILGVTSIIIDPSDTMTIYAGTGEVYRNDTMTGTPIPTNVGYNVWKARGTYGVGILKSTNGGSTWSKSLDTVMSGLFGIQRLRFDPTNSNIVYACTTAGLYKTTNAGTLWTRILNKPYVSDVVINAKNNNQVVIAYGNMQNVDKGVLRSTDGGATWNTVTGMPGAFQGMIKFDNVTSLGNRDTIIASVGICEVPSGTNELYRSTNFGSTWTVLANSTHTQWQYWCAHNLAINPSNTDKLIFGGVKLKNYTISTTTAGGSLAVHDDIHDVKFDPLNANNVYCACDGGMYKSTNGGGAWSQIDNGLAATQFYASIGVSPTNANIIVGGLQDNGVWWTTNGGTTWNSYPGGYGDGAACAIDPTNGQNIITSGDARNFYLSTNGGTTANNTMAYLAAGAPATTHDSRTSFVAPVAYSKKKPTVVYAVSDNLHKSTNGGSTWTNNGAYNVTNPINYAEALRKPGIAVAVSPSDPNGDTVYVSTSPFAQADNDGDGVWVNGQPNILKSTNGGATLPMTSIKGTLPDRFVMDFAISSTHADSVYIVLGGFGTSHIYVSPNGGGTWNALGAGLPDVPFNAIIFDPVNPKIIYAGCDFGVYVSADRGLTWTDYSTGFWDATQVVDLQITANNKLLAATHGKGIFISDLAVFSSLPVTLIDFGGVNRNTFNDLHWTVAQEYNLSRYELERSSDGVHFQRITTVTAGNSTSQKTYNYSDPVNPVSSENYYRLKMIDIDGSYKYSSVVLIKVVTKNKFSVAGNPFNDIILLQYNLAKSQPLTISLFNAAGALMKKEEYNATSGSGAYMMAGYGSYAKGIYLLRIDTNEGSQTIKLQKN